MGSSFAGRFKVGTRIYTGFIVVVILLAVVAVFGARGLNTVDAIFDRYIMISGNAEQGVAIQRDVAEMRRNVRLYGMPRDEQYLATARLNMSALTGMLAKTLNATASPAFPDEICALHASGLPKIPPSVYVTMSAI